MSNHTLMTSISNLVIYFHFHNNISFLCMIQFRGSEVIELQHFQPASTDDIASVHARAYVSGLEKVTY